MSVTPSRLQGKVWREDALIGDTSRICPEGSPEADAAIRRVFATLNPSKDYDETMARLRRERGKPEPDAKPLSKMATCRMCDVLFIQGNGSGGYCGPCSATRERMKGLVR